MIADGVTTSYYVEAADTCVTSMRATLIFDPCRQRLGYAFQHGTADQDYIDAAAAGPNGTYVFVGTTRGDWSEPNAGIEDWVVFKVDSERNILWRWQVSVCRRLFHFCRSSDPQSTSDVWPTYGRGTGTFKSPPCFQNVVNY